MEVHLAAEIPFAVDIPVDEVTKRLVGGHPVETLFNQGVKNIYLNLVHPGQITLSLGKLRRAQDEPP
jgi:hypothetical protein